LTKPPFGLFIAPGSRATDESIRHAAEEQRREGHHPGEERVELVD
jgi:hypothetical protein